MIRDYRAVRLAANRTAAAVEDSLAAERSGTTLSHHGDIPKGFSRRTHGTSLAFPVSMNGTTRIPTVVSQPLDSPWTYRFFIIPIISRSEVGPR